VAQADPPGAWLSRVTKTKGGLIKQRAVAVAALALLLAPSARLAWNSRDIPHLGYFHDDSLYWVCAKSLAEGSSYRILSLPDQPYQTKYPPLYPWLLSLIWRIRPAFPDNLALAALLSWLLLPALVILANLVYSDLGLPRLHRWALCGWLALNPNLAFFSINLLSELLFCCLLMGFLILAERSRNSASGSAKAAAAGLIAGAAYLTRAAAIPLLISAPLCFLLRSQWRKAAMSLVGVGAAILGWWFWARAHQSASSDVISLYYTGYFSFHLSSLSWRDAPAFIWKNLQDLLSGTGSLIVFHLGDSLWSNNLLRILAVLAIIGTIRLTRTGGVSQYSVFAAGYLALLLLWHFPPNERFILPAFPLLLAGLSVELRYIAARLLPSFRSPRLAPRLAAAVLVAGLGASAWVAAGRAAGALGRLLPDLVAEHRQRLAGLRLAYDWISRNTAPDAAFLAYHDPVLYLYTGRRGARLIVPVAPYYRGDRQAVLRPFHALAEFARAHNLSHLLLTSGDFQHGEWPAGEPLDIRRLVGADKAFRLLYESPTASVYRLEP